VLACMRCPAVNRVCALQNLMDCFVDHFWRSFSQRQGLANVDGHRVTLPLQLSAIAFDATTTSPTTDQSPPCMACSSSKQTAIKAVSCLQSS